MKRHFDSTKLKAWLACPDYYQKATALDIVWHERDAIADHEVVTLVERLALTDDNDNLRCDAIRCLGDLDLQRSIKVLVKALDDNHFLARGNAVLSLEKLTPDFHDIPEIKELTERETHPFVRWALGTD